VSGTVDNRRESRGTGTASDTAPPSFPAVTLYVGDARDLVRALKFHGRRRLAVDAARLIADRWRPAPVVPGVRTVVTWAPTTPERRAERGFDQAEIIARHLAPMIGLSVRRLLRRTSSGHQTGSPRAARLDGPAFVARPVRGLHVVVVDDVVTTGATFAAAVTALDRAGASGVECIAVARTPFSERTPVG
jgi:predicted amidophosphoribosyltransferase